MALGDPTKAQQFCFHPSTKATCKEPSKTFYSIESFQNESHQQYVGPKERGFSRTGPGRLETRGVKGCELLEEDSTEVSCHRREGVDILASPATKPYTGGTRTECVRCLGMFGLSCMPSANTSSVPAQRKGSCTSTVYTSAQNYCVETLHKNPKP